MKALSILLVAAIANLDLAYAGQGSAEGNSSDAWVCRTARSEIWGSVFLRDLGWVEDELNIQPDLPEGTDIGIISQTAELMLNRLAEFDPIRADEFRPEVEELAKIFEAYETHLKEYPNLLPVTPPNRWYENVVFSWTPLSPKAPPNGCGWERVIRYLEPHVPEMKRYKVNAEIFGRLSYQEKGVAAFHEIVNKAAVAEENRRNAEKIDDVGTAKDLAALSLESIANTYKVWYLVGKLAGNAIDDVSEYAHAIGQLRFEEYNFRGIWMDPQSVEFPNSNDLVEGRLTRPYVFNTGKPENDSYQPGETIVFDDSGEPNYEKTRAVNRIEIQLTISQALAQLTELARVDFTLENTSVSAGSCEILIEKKPVPYRIPSQDCAVLLARGKYTVVVTIERNARYTSGVWSLSWFGQDPSSSGSFRQPYQLSNETQLVYTGSIEVHSKFSATGKLNPKVQAVKEKEEI